MESVTGFENSSIYPNPAGKLFVNTNLVGFGRRTGFAAKSQDFSHHKMFMNTNSGGEYSGESLSNTKNHTNILYTTKLLLMVSIRIMGSGFMEKKTKMRHYHLPANLPFH